MVEKMIIITTELLNSGQSIRGSWNMQQLHILGVDDLTKGWKKRLIGKEFTQDQIDKFLLLKNSHLKKSYDLEHFNTEKDLAMNLLDELLKESKEVICSPIRETVIPLASVKRIFAYYGIEKEIHF